MEHFLTRAMNKGSCRKLTGNMVFFLTYVSDPEYVWTDADIRKASDTCISSIKRLKAAAKEDNVPLRCYVHEQKVTIQCPLSVKNNSEWRTQIAKNLGASNMEALHAALQKKFGMETIVYVFMTGKAGRAYALPVHTNSNYAEGVVLFKEFNSILHEVFHLFGAADYYYPERLAVLARRYFPGSIMLVGGNGDIDDVTRYLIGWHSQPTEKALAFLGESSVISAQEADESLRKQWETSPGKQKMRYSQSTYEGEMKDGLMHGHGVLIFDDGSRYEGEFRNGTYHGVGTMLYSDGTLYAGYFRDGTLDGEGTMIYSDGHRYVGHFRNGTFDGMGRMTYPDGKVYEGEYKEGAMHGHGTFTDKNGKVLMKGRFEKNRFLG